MSAEIVIRHPGEQDLEQVVVVRNDSRRELSEHRDETFEEVEADIFSPDYDAEGSWVALENGKVVGYAVGLVESGRLKAGRKEARIDIDILPSHRSHGFGKGLVDKVLAYARARGVNAVLTRCESLEEWKRDLLVGSGFKVVHHWYRMVRTGRSRPRIHPLPPGYKLASSLSKQLSNDEIGKLVSVSNDAFSEVFDYFPITPEDAMKLMNSTQDIDRDAWVEKDGQVIGLCVSEECTAFNKEHNSRMGYILVLCVLKSHGRAGIGAALLVDGIRWILDRGMDQIFLAVDAENPSALDLYVSHGFSVLREGAYYRVSL